jgi:hypothetical protein
VEVTTVTSILTIDSNLPQYVVAPTSLNDSGVSTRLYFIFLSSFRDFDGISAPGFHIFLSFIPLNRVYRLPPVTASQADQWEASRVWTTLMSREPRLLGGPTRRRDNISCASRRACEEHLGGKVSTILGRHCQDVISCLWLVFQTLVPGTTSSKFPEAKCSSVNTFECSRSITTFTRRLTSVVATIRTTYFNILKPCIFPHREHLRVPYCSHNKQRLFP